MHNNRDVTKGHALIAYEKEVEDFRLGSFQLQVRTEVALLWAVLLNKGTVKDSNLSFGRVGRCPERREKHVLHIV